MTDSKPFQDGEMWHEKQLVFDRSFECQFGFKLDNGVNGESEGTSPGADGLALVISKDIPTYQGENGGGLGYNGINGAVAIEFDSFINKNRYDPEYDHVAIFASSGFIDNNHSSSSCLGTARISSQLKADLKLRDVFVKYERDARVLSVYLDDKDGSGTPILSVQNYDFEKYFGKPFGYIGITSSTGSSMENHYITNLNVCFHGESTTSVESASEKVSNTDKVYPNPANEFVNIIIPAGICVGSSEIKIFNQIGNEVSKQQIQTVDSGVPVSINVSGLSSGVYFVRINCDNKYVTVPFVKE